MNAWPPAAIEKSRELAAVMGQRPIDQGDGVYHVPSFSGAGTYVVMRGLDGAFSCNCGDYEHRRHECPHIRYVRSEMTTTALATIKVLPPARAIPSRDELQDMSAVAAYLAASGAVAIPTNLKRVEDIKAVVLAGWEVGVKPMTALRHIGVVNGKTEPDGQLMAGIILAREPDASFEVMKETVGTEDDYTIVRFTRPSRNLIKEYQVSMSDAKRAGLLSKPGPWQQYPRDMRRWHAMKRLARTYAPDIINGIASVSLGDLSGPMTAEPVDEPFIDSTATQAIEPSRLFSEGDDPDAPIEGMIVDRETGEILTPTGPTEQQRGAITDYTEQLKASRSKADAKVLTDALDAWRRAELPEGLDGDSWSWMRLAPPLAERYLVRVREAHEGKGFHVCANEARFDEDGVVMRCGICGFVVEEAPPAQGDPVDTEGQAAALPFT